MSAFTAVTYNVRHAALDDGLDAWPRRRRGVETLLQALDPDLLGLQESTGDQQADLAGALGGYDWHGVADDPGSGEHNPVGVGARFDPLDAETVWLSETPAVPGSTGWDAAYPRALTRVTLRDGATGRRLALFNTHFDHRGGRAREESARLLRRRVDALDPHVEAVVLGDFNCRPDDTAYHVLVGGGYDRRLVDARDRATTVEGPASTVGDFEGLDPGRQLDHVLVTDGLAVERYRVCDRRDERGRFPSDHLPVAVALSLGS